MKASARQVLGSMQSAAVVLIVLIIRGWHILFR